MEAQLHLPVLRVPAGGVEGGAVRAAAAAFQDQDGVRRPHNARGAGEPVERVAVPQLADVVHHQQSDLQLVRQSFQLAHLLIVAAVGLVPAKGTHHGEGVHRHQHGVRVLPHKAADLLQQAAGHGLRLGGEVGVPRHLVGDAVQPILHPAEGVLQTQVQGGSLLGGQAPHRLPLGDADAPVQHHPGLANLGRPAQEAHPLGQQRVHAEAGGLQVKAHQSCPVNGLQVSLFHRIISFVFSFPPPPEREKVGAVFYIPDFMEIQTPRAFPNRPERWWDNLESAEDFSHGEGRLFPNAPAYFCRGAALFFSPIPQGMGNTKAPTEEKRWE